MKKLITLLLTGILAIALLTVSISAETVEFTNTDLTSTYDAASANVVQFNGETNDYTISAAGTYLLSGTLNATLYVDAANTDKIQLVLNGVEIHSSSGPAIYVKQADKVVLTLAEGTVNNISDGVNYTLDEEGANAAIYSKDDLSINGIGTLTVNGQTAHGIVSKDDLVIVSGNINVTAVKDGLRGKDSLLIKDGTFVIKSGSDGLISTNEDTGYGNIYIENGTFTIESGRDGIEAKGALKIVNGTFTITTYSASVTADDSLKALKAVDSIHIQDGNFTINAQDDGIHSNTDISIEKGTFYISSGDDGIHADYNVTIYDGVIIIQKSVEGIEGFTVTIHNGTVDITASDDGINATNGESTTGQNREAAQAGVGIVINGGTVKVVASNDALDSNGTITINGGDINLTTQNLGGGTGTLDANGAVTINGGNVVTNDGGINGMQRPGGGRRR